MAKKDSITNPDTSPEARRAAFPLTAWTALQHPNGQGAENQKALKYLCENYWRPVFGFIARRTANHELAEDLTQKFFVRLLENPVVIEKADRTRGRFRVFLANRLRWFLKEQHKQGQRAKEVQPADDAQPPVSTDWDGEQDFAKRYAQNAVSRALAMLDDNYREAGNDRRRQILSRHQEGLGATEIATALNISLDTAKNELRAIRRDSQECLRTIIRAEVRDDQTAEEEMEEIRQVLTAERPAPLDQRKAAVAHTRANDAESKPEAE